MRVLVPAGCVQKSSGTLPFRHREHCATGGRSGAQPTRWAVCHGARGVVASSRVRVRGSLNFFRTGCYNGPAPVLEYLYSVPCTSFMSTY